MKHKYLLISVFLFLALVITGCSGENVINPDNTEIDYIHILTPSETYDYSNNVYEGVLLEFDEINTDSREDVKIKVKVTRTFKGKNMPGEVVEDYLCICGISSAMEYGATFDKGTKYLFMTQGGACDNGHDYWLCFYHVVPLQDESGKNLVNSYMKKMGYDDAKSTYYDMLCYKMLSLGETEFGFGCQYWGDAHGFDVNNTFHGRIEDNYKFNQIDLGQLFVLADNVYIGEEIEREDLGTRKNIVECYDNDIDVYIYAVKIRVVDVIKGKYKPGDTIIDVMVYSYGEGTHVYFSGEGFFEGYNEALVQARELFGETE